MSDKNVSAQKTEREIRVEKIINETTILRLKSELTCIQMGKNDLSAILEFKEKDVEKLVILLSPEIRKVCSEMYGIIKRAVEQATYRTMVEFPSSN